MDTDGSDEVIDMFARHIPEIASGVVELKAVARVRGYRAKLAVLSHDPNVDPVAVCVGVRGYRIKNVVDELGGERIDIVRWVDSPEQFIPNALQPARIEAVLLDHARHRATVIVSEDQVSLASGRGGMNRELASRLSGWEIVIEARETSDGEEAWP